MQMTSFKDNVIMKVWVVCGGEWVT